MSDTGNIIEQIEAAVLKISGNYMPFPGEVTTSQVHGTDKLLVTYRQATARGNNDSDIKKMVKDITLQMEDSAILDVKIKGRVAGAHALEITLDRNKLNDALMDLQVADDIIKDNQFKDDMRRRVYYQLTSGVPANEISALLDEVGNEWGPKNKLP